MTPPASCYVHGTFKPRFYCRPCIEEATSQYRLLPDGPDSDYPVHCLTCGRLLLTDLSEAGILLVFAHAVEWLCRGRSAWDDPSTPLFLLDKRGPVLQGDYYRGRRAVEVVRDWAGMVVNEFELPQAWMVKLLGYFLRVTEDPAGRVADRPDPEVRRKVRRLPRSLRQAMAGTVPEPPPAKAFDRHGRRPGKPPPPDEEEVEFWDEFFQGDNHADRSDS